MPQPARSGLGEAAITTTLLSLYLSLRGTHRALGVVQSALGGLERGRPGRGGRLRPLDGGPALRA
jgi:hypothetical protein